MTTRPNRLLKRFLLWWGVHGHYQEDIRLELDIIETELYSVRLQHRDIEGALRYLLDRKEYLIRIAQALSQGVDTATAAGDNNAITPGLTD